MPMLCSVKASVAAVNTASAWAPAASARAGPPSFGTRTRNRTPAHAGNPARSPGRAQAFFAIGESVPRGLDAREDLSARPRVAGPDGEGGHGATDRRAEGMPHLHRLEGHDGVARLDLFTGGAMDGDDRA